MSNFSASEMLGINIEALSRFQKQLGPDFDHIVEAMTQRVSDGKKIVVTGLGKNYAIGQKIASTLTSTGSPAIMLHPSEAMHGDLGIIGDGDVLLALSYSGETEELLAMLPHATLPNCLLVAITGNPDSSLAKKSNHVISIAIDREACPFNLAPTTSALLTLAAGDMLAMLIHQSRGFTQEDYARLHPHGTIGNTLLLCAADIMRKDERLSSVNASDTVHEAILKMTSCQSGAVGVTDNTGKLVGVFTDGDFRRLASNDPDYDKRPLSEVMVPQPKRLLESARITEVIHQFKQNRINCILVVNADDQLTGLIDLQDLPKLKLL